MPLSTDHSGHPVLNATRARSARPGRPVLYVLLFSTLLAALGLFAAWMWKSGELASVEHANNGKQPAAAQAFNTPPPPAPAGPRSDISQPTPAGR